MEITSEELSREDLAHAKVVAEAGDVASPGPLDGFWLVAAGVIPILGMLPMMLVELYRLWGRAHYRAIPFAMIAFIVLVGINFRPAFPDRRRLTIGLALSVIGGSLGVASIVFFQPVWSHIALVISLSGWLIVQLGETRLSRIGALVGVMLATIPLAVGFDVAVLRWFQAIGASWTNGLLDAMGIFHILEGEFIQARYYALPTVRVGSGPDSIYTFLVFATILIAARRHGWMASLLILVSVPLWFVLYLSLSQTVLAAYGDAQGRALVELPFTLVRMSMLLLTVVSFIMFDVAITSLFWHPRWKPSTEDQWLEDELILQAQPSVGLTSDRQYCLYTVGPVAAVVLVGGLLSAYLISTNRSIAFFSKGVSGATLSAVAAMDAFPEQLDQWKRVDYQITLANEAENSGRPVYVWQYAKGIDRFTLELNSSVPSDPTIRYRSQGWRLVENEAKIDGTTQRGVPFVLNRMQNSIDQKLFVLSSAVKSDGAVAASPAQETQLKWFDTIFTKLTERESATNPDVFTAQLQYVAVGAATSPPAEILALYEGLVERVASRMKPGVSLQPAPDLSVDADIVEQPAEASAER